MATRNKMKNQDLLLILGAVALAAGGFWYVKRRQQQQQATLQLSPLQAANLGQFFQ